MNCKHCSAPDTDILFNKSSGECFPCFMSNRMIGSKIITDKTVLQLSRAIREDPTLIGKMLKESREKAIISLTERVHEQFRKPNESNINLH